MPTQVIAYADPLHLNQHPELQSRAGWVHICATTTLAQGMRQRFGDSLAVISMLDVVDLLLEEWMSDVVRLRQYARLTRLVEDLRQAHPEWGQTLRAFRRNQREALLAIRQLAETNLSPDSLHPQTTEEMIFQALWAGMEQQDETLQRVRRALNEQLPSDRSFARRLTQVVLRALKEGRGRSERGPQKLDWDPLKSGIVLHGFYFISPIQLQIFRLCEAAGISLTFMNYYDPRYPAVFSTWDAFFTSANGLPGRDQWTMPTPEQLPDLPEAGQVLGDIFSGNTLAVQASGRLSGTRIWRFEDFGQFLKLFDPGVAGTQVRGLEGAEAKVGYYSPESQRLNRFLREHFPEAIDRQRRHFLAYPVGQLLFHLHTMWDDQTGELKTTDHALYECFASGWLQAGQLNGRQYVRALQDLLPFFVNCSTFKEWRERAQLLREAHTKAVRRFDTSVSRDQRNWRFHQYLSNPLERLAYFKIEPETLDAVMLLMERLFVVAEQLFTNDEVGLTEHFRRIEELLLEQADPDALLVEERELLHGLRERMAQGASGEDRFLPQDLAEAIMLYLGGELTDSNFEESSEEELVGSLVGSDGAYFRTDIQRLHLCLLGENSLPKRRSVFPWPLSAQTFAHMPDHIAIRLLTLREQESKRADRYLFFSAVTWAEDITLSWIVRWQDEELGPSAYLMLLDPYCRTAAAYQQSWSEGLEAPQSTLQLPVPGQPEAYESFPEDALAELALCPRRFYYSFLTQQSPSYSGDFHHRFLYGSLVKALAQTSGMPVSRVADEVGKLFPQWTDLQRQDILDRVPDAWPDYDRYDGADYPKSRYAVELLQLSRSQGHEAAIEALQHSSRRSELMAQLSSWLTEGSPLLPAKPSHACRYCPHIGYCDAAQHPVDDIEEA